MDLLANEDQQQIIDAFSRASREMFPVEAVRTRMDESEWRQIAELGWLGLWTPESDGGAGLGHVEAILLFREIGRQLVPGPLLSTILAGRMASAAGDTQLAGAIVGGQSRVALIEPPDPSADEQRWRLIDGEHAQLGLLISPHEAALFELPSERAQQVSVDPASSLQLIAPMEQSEVSVSGEDVRLWAVLVVAAMAAGICEAASEASAEYAKVREQFGRPIGSFQAVSHRCADMAARADVAWMQTVMAALSCSENSADRAFQVDAARVTACDAALASSADNVQNHGGMGFTEELPPHRYAKRAFLLDRLVGGRRAALERILETPAPVVQGQLRTIS